MHDKQQSYDEAIEASKRAAADEAQKKENAREAVKKSIRRTYRAAERQSNVKSFSQQLRENYKAKRLANKG
jgi:hypothetical protein